MAESTCWELKHAKSVLHNSVCGPTTNSYFSINFNLQLFSWTRWSKTSFFSPQKDITVALEVTRWNRSGKSSMAKRTQVAQECCLQAKTQKTTETEWILTSRLYPLQLPNTHGYSQRWVCLNKSNIMSHTTVLCCFYKMCFVRKLASFLEQISWEMWGIENAFFLISLWFCMCLHERNISVSVCSDARQGQDALWAEFCGILSETNCVSQKLCCSYTKEPENTQLYIITWGHQAATNTQKEIRKTSNHKRDMGIRKCLPVVPSCKMSCWQWQSEKLEVAWNERFQTQTSLLSSPPLRPVCSLWIRLSNTTGSPTLYRISVRIIESKSLAINRTREKITVVPATKWVLPFLQILDSSQINHIAGNALVGEWSLESNDAEPGPWGPSSIGLFRCADLPSVPGIPITPGRNSLCVALNLKWRRVFFLFQ